MINVPAPRAPSHPFAGTCEAVLINNHNPVYFSSKIFNKHNMM